MSQNVAGAWYASRFSSGRAGVNKHHSEAKKPRIEDKPTESPRLKISAAFQPSQAKAKEYFVQLVLQINWRLVEQADDPRAVFAAQIQMSGVICPGVRLLTAHKCGEDVCVLLEFSAYGKTTAVTYFGKIFEYRLFLKPDENSEKVS